MNEKRDKMIGFMVTKEIERKLRDEAAKRNTTLSTLTFQLVCEGLNKNSPEQKPVNAY